MDDFRNGVIKELRRLLGNRYQVLPHDGLKNNEIALHGICIHGANETISPVIRLEEYILPFAAGKMTLKEIAFDLLLKYCKDEMPKNAAEHVKDFRMMKDRIRIKVINYSANAQRLERIPHRRFLDLVIAYYVDMEIRINSRNASMEITNELMGIWNVSEGDLYRIGIENMSVKDSFYADEIIGKIKELLRVKPDREIEQKLKSFQENAGPKAEVYVVSNKKHLFGACCLVNRPFLQKLAVRTESNLLIYPLNVTEVLVCPIEKGNKNCMYIRNMQEINNQDEYREDCLSNSIYLYDRVKQDVFIYEEGEPL
mgnify:CR=1 FL=1